MAKPPAPRANDVDEAATDELDDDDDAGNRPGGPTDHGFRRWLAHPDAAPLAALALAFVVSRLGYAAAGIRFDAEPLFYLVQLVEPELLADRLVESLWYLHSQPPGFNLLVGVVLRWSPFDAGVSFQIAYLAFGALLAWALYDLGRSLLLGRWGAAVVAGLIVVSPVVVLYENWLSYEYPVAAMLAALTAAAARWVRNGHVSALVAVSALGTACVLTRSLLHPMWLVGVLVVVVVARRPNRWSMAVIATLVLPVIVVGGLMAKNQVLFGTTQLSSWFGFNVHKMAVGALPEDVRDQLRDDGLVSAPGFPQPCERERPDIEVLGPVWLRGERGAEEIGNPNDECTLAWYSQLSAEALEVARAEPRAVGRNVVGSAEIWVTPGSLYFSLIPNRSEIEGLDTLHRRVIMGDVAWEPPVEVPGGWAAQLSAPDERHHISITLVLATLAVLVGGVVVLVRWPWRGLSSPRAVVLVAAGTVGYVAVASIVFEHGENHRIRWLSEPLTLVVAVALVAWGVRALLRRRRSGG